MATHRILLSTRINLDEVNFPHSRKSDIISPHSFQLPLPLFSSSSRGHTPLLPVPSLAKTCMDSSKRFWQKRLKAYKFLMWWICCCFSLSESSFISWKESRIRRHALTHSTNIYQVPDDILEHVYATGYKAVTWLWPHRLPLQSNHK